ncbi:MAG TPA: dTDP-4-dehydrorhamnose 3,5-epimerase family protein [Steroidobacteraceae bacterium]|nr:dTDP-4-dehydrorhamnose 3,5-epimerase family protein [Steroidobacteraceae bacterium]
MMFTELPLAGAYRIDLTRVEDERGFFARSFCAEEFAARGLAAAMPQSSVSFNARRATLRGMHYRAEPHAEDKLVRCTAGAVYDVVVDLRPGSATHRRWFATELTAENRRSLYVPKGCAHGFITLADATEVLYMISVPHVAGFDRGVRWNDPLLGIAWPLEPAVIAARDAAYPLLDAAAVP